MPELSQHVSLIRLSCETAARLTRPCRGKLLPARRPLKLAERASVFRATTFLRETARCSAQPSTFRTALPWCETAPRSGVSLTPPKCAVYSATT